MEIKRKKRRREGWPTARANLHHHRSNNNNIILAEEEEENTSFKVGKISIKIIAHTERERETTLLAGRRSGRNHIVCVFFTVNHNTHKTHILTSMTELKGSGAGVCPAFPATFICIYLLFSCCWDFSNFFFFSISSSQKVRHLFFLLLDSSSLATFPSFFFTLNIFLFLFQVGLFPFLLRPGKKWNRRKRRKHEMK